MVDLSIAIATLVITRGYGLWCGRIQVIQGWKPLGRTGELQTLMSFMGISGSTRWHVPHKKRVESRPIGSNWLAARFVTFPVGSLAQIVRQLAWLGVCGKEVWATQLLVHLAVSPLAEDITISKTQMLGESPTIHPERAWLDTWLLVFTSRDSQCQKSDQRTWPSGLT